MKTRNWMWQGLPVGLVLLAGAVFGAPPAGEPTN